MLIAIVVFLIVTGIVIGLICLGMANSPEWKMIREAQVGNSKSTEWEAESKAKALTEMLRRTNEEINEGRRAVFNAPFPTYTGVGSEKMFTIDEIDSLMGYLKECDRGREIVDNTTMGYYKELVAEAPGKWSNKMAEYRQYMDRMDKSHRSLIGSIIQMIGHMYQMMERSDVNPSPEFKRAWDAKVGEFKDYVSRR